MSEASPREIFVAAMAAAKDRRTEDALAGFDAIAARVPDDASALCQAGLLRLRMERPGEAVRDFKEAIRRQPDNMTALFALGEAKEKLGDDEGAVEAFSKVARRRPNYAPARANLGVLARRAGSLATAIGHFTALTRLTPGEAQSHLLLAASCHRARMMEAAVPAFRRALCLEPAGFDGLYNLGVTEPLLGWREEALRHLKWASIIHPFAADVYARISRLSAKAGESDAALRAGRRALCLDPVLPEPLFIMSGLSGGEAKIAALQRVVSVAPEHETAPFRLAEAYFKSGNLGAAEMVMRQQVREREDQDEALFILRRIMAAAGKDDRFQAEFGDHVTDYDRWVSAFSTVGAAQRQTMSTMIGSWEQPPSFDIIMPVCDPPPDLLNAAITSLKVQAYPHWRLCIADDGSGDLAVRALLSQAAEDARIDVVFRQTRSHISAASNSALELARGDYVGFLDHDDLLAEDALFWMAREIAENPALDLLYSDEDKVDESGRRFDPHFKPDWTLELLRAQNYICHLAVYRRALVQELGGLRLGYEGSQDHDLALRVVEKSTVDRIAHIPRILYHWRAIEGSTARDGGAKPYTIRAGGHAVADHLRRTGAPATVDISDVGFRIRWSLADPPPVTVIVPTRDRPALLKRAVTGVLEGTDYPDLSLIIVDNDSRERATLSYLKEVEQDPRVRVLASPGRFNYSAFNNMAVRRDDRPVLCFLNNDTEPKTRDWLREMVSHAWREDVGAVGAKLLYPDDTVQHAGLHLAGEAGAKHIHTHLEDSDPGYWNRAMAPQELSAVTGAALVMRREVFEVVGGFDGEIFPVDFSDVDLCLRVRDAGYKIIWTPHAVLYHHESASRGTFISRDKERSYGAAQQEMMTRYGDRLYTDPYGNPNLDLTARDFRPAFPPRIKGLK